MAQFGGAQPAVHTHVYSAVSPIRLHCPPFKHGVDKHGSGAVGFKTGEKIIQEMNLSMSQRENRIFGAAWEKKVLLTDVTVFAGVGIRTLTGIVRLVRVVCALAVLTRR